MSPPRPDVLRSALFAAGIPEGFSVVPVAQLVPRSLIRDIEALIDVFERVTTRPRWQQAATADAPSWARGPHREVCFFSAWDFHVPADAPERWQLIEFNDNGSGFWFASIIDRTYYALAGLAGDPAIEAPHPDFDELVASMIDREACAYFGERPPGLLLVLDDADSLARGHFRAEHEHLARLARARGWQAEVAAPEQLAANGHALQLGGRDVSFVVNRSTDFLWQGDAFEPLRACFAAGTVYVAPNPFTYLTRSDKQLFELLSSPARDEELGIQPDERALLSARVPETIVLRESNVDELAARKHELFFKPARGFASRGTISSAQIGRSRLRRLLNGPARYVAQRFVPQSRLEVPGVAEPLYADLRVWAYRGTRYLVSGRASTRADRRELRGGGWIPTFVRDDAAST